MPHRVSQFSIAKEIKMGRLSERAVIITGAGASIGNGYRPPPCCGRRIDAGGRVQRSLLQGDGRGIAT
ncbi:protein of unknown function [Denitratisoma oestradiolicum]|uniref:Uncharacterized protein n=1 Tax=Denitratisoma oestradiolicum TaxID=311182 RepID=A0A6S6XZ84_9PROT|nr:protein of unknown function [Denitratisoma oestradiolicum]